MQIAVPMDDVYNRDHFRTGILVADFYRTIKGLDLMPGDTAPDFTLPIATGGHLRLSEHLDRPVVLKFGSYS